MFPWAMAKEAASHLPPYFHNEASRGGDIEPGDAMQSSGAQPSLARGSLALSQQPPGALGRGHGSALILGSRCNNDGMAV